MGREMETTDCGPFGKWKFGTNPDTPSIGILKFDFPVVADCRV